VKPRGRGEVNEKGGEISALLSSLSVSRFQSILAAEVLTVKIFHFRQNIKYALAIFAILLMFSLPMSPEAPKSGILLVAKPVGISSFDVIRKLRKILNTRKIGHAGTLDPFASGLMILGVNRGTKLLSRFLKADKCYRAELFFGMNSTTDDPEGEKTVVPRAKAFSQTYLESVLPLFLGKIQQVPPLYSALKIKGKRACDRVRKGEDVSAEVQAKVREVEIFTITILEFAFPKVVLDIHCGSGTYIRSLARDLGEKLGTGAYLTALTRTMIGKFELGLAKKMEEVTLENVF